MADDTNIQLLAQRLEAQEKLNAEQQRELTDLRTQIDRRTGAEQERGRSAGWAQKLLPTGVGLLATVFGAVIFSDLQTVKEKQNKDALAIERKAQKFEHVNLRLDNLEDKKGVNIAPLEARLVAAEANVTRLDLAVMEHEEEIDDLEDQQAEQQKKVSSISASSTASFTEVETQIRSTWDVINTMEGYNRQIDGLMWKKLYDEPLPDNEYFSTNIPAQATTQIGKVNGD